MPDRRRLAIGAGLAGLGVVAAMEALAVARVVRQEDPGGRSDHARTVGTGLGEPVRLVLLGDSAVDGHGLRAAEALPNQVAVRVADRTGRRVRVRSLAVSGATSRDVADGQVPLLRAARGADAVVVGVGVNDALRRVPSAAVRDATQDIVDGVREAAPAALLVVLPCHDLRSAPGLGPVLRRALAWRCRTVARAQQDVLAAAGVVVVEPERPGPPEAYGEDGLHPGPRAVQALASLVADALVAEAPTAATT